MKNKINKFIINNTELNFKTGLYILMFKDTKHYYIGSSTDLPARLQHYRNSTKIISKNVKDAIDAFGVDSLRIHVIELQEDISREELLKKEDKLLQDYHKLIGTEFCLNSRNNENTWHSNKFKEKNKIKHRPIECFDKKTLELLYKFECISEAVKFFKFQNSGNIVANLKNRSKSLKNMIFKYTDVKN